MSGKGRPRVAVIDYGAGNIVSISQALAAVGADVSLVASPDGLPAADILVVPGVGAAAAAMMRLRRRGLDDPIRDWIAADRPYLGICLGFQVLFERSEEGNARTLGVLPGRTERLRNAPSLPHIGWNSIDPAARHPLLRGIAAGSHFYFVHSFAPNPADDGAILARTTHGEPFVSAVAMRRIVGVQFHPERSSTLGLRFLANFLAWAGEATPC